MQIVIEIAEDIKEDIDKHSIDMACSIVANRNLSIAEAIRNGTKLPFVHRRQIDKVKEELERQRKWLFKAGYNAYNIDIAFDTIKSLLKGEQE